MRIRKLILILVVLICSQVPLRVGAVTYEYIGAPLSSYVGSTLSGHPVILEFSTYNILPSNLTFDRASELPPAHSVPVINWSLSVGQYQASGIGNPAGGDVTVGPDGKFQASAANDFYFLQFDTNSSGAIIGWFFFANPVTTNRNNLISVAIGTDFYPSIAGPYDDFVQVNQNVVGTSFTDLGIATSPGTWTLLDPTAIAPVPEPSTWAMLLVGFVGIGFVSRRRRTYSAPM